MTVFEATAAVREEGYSTPVGEIFLIEFTARLPTAAEGTALAASFPKSWRVKGGRLLTTEGERGYAQLKVMLTPEKGNPANEAGLKRAQAFAQRASWAHSGPRYKNQAEPAALEALLGTTPKGAI